MDANIQLDEVVNFYLDAWELPDGQYGRIHSLAVRGYRQIYMHATATPITIPLEVLPNKTSPLPCDCLNKLSVGIINQNGELSSLTENEILTLGESGLPKRTSQTTEPILVDDDNNIFYDPDGNFLTPFIFGEFGVGAQSDLGFYRIDWDQRVIVYDFQFRYSQVWLEYIPVASNNGTYPVNPFFVEAIIAFIGWNDKRRSISDRNISKVEYYNEMRIGKRSMKPFDPSQAFAQYYRTTRQARY